MAERGFVLVASLLLLVVVTIMAVSMFRSSGVAEKIAGNMREKQRALQSAVSAQQYAEWWLANNSSTGTNCTGLKNANSGEGQVCSNVLSAAVADVTAVPWKIAGAEVGVNYTPPNMTVTQSSAAGTYYQAPRFYISYLGSSASGLGDVYQIDAVGYGGGAEAVAVVESTYLIGGSVKNLGAL